MSALLILWIIWGFIGYSFGIRYLKSSSVIASIIAIVMLFVVTQIERQIILSVQKNVWARAFRILIGVVMALIGSIIIDQILFLEDIKKEKISIVQVEVDSLLPKKTRELNRQIVRIDSLIRNSELERLRLIEEVARKPVVTVPNYSSVRERDSTGKMITVSQTISNQQIPNPKGKLIADVDNRIDLLREQRVAKDTVMLNMQYRLEKELSQRTGLLDEIDVLISIFRTSPVSVFVWMLFFVFFLSLELFVLIIKLGDKDNDYDAAIRHQVNTRLKMLRKIQAEE
jgi:hypothetical protein